MCEEKMDLYEKKARYFLEQKEEVHATMKSGLFYNGFIVEVSSDFFIIDDRKLGKMPVFFFELKNIEKCEVSK